MALTYDPIASTTLGADTASVTFSSISSAYTDLVLVINMGQANQTASPAIRLNGDTTTNYSITELYGNGSTANSTRASSSTELYYGYSITGAGSLQSNAIFHFMNYANTTTYKTVLMRFNTLGGTYPGTSATVGLWRKTPEAINTILLRVANGSNYLSGSTFTLYGIKAA